MIAQASSALPVHLMAVALHFSLLSNLRQVTGHEKVNIIISINGQNSVEHTTLPRRHLLSPECQQTEIDPHSCQPTSPYLSNYLPP